jgi:hypothetical protein
MYCLCLLLWGVPNFLVHSWGFLARIFRHSSNGKNFAAIRAGQQMLQGFHLVPSAGLPRLHDTHLKSSNVTVDGLPIDGQPFRRSAGDRTNGVHRRQPSSRATLRSPRPLRTVRDGFPITRLKPFERLFQGDATLRRKDSGGEPCHGILDEAERGLQHSLTHPAQEGRNDASATR